MVGCVHSSGKSSSIDIDGTWKGEMKSRFGGPPRQYTFNFKKVDDSVKGTVNGMPDQWIPLEDLEIKGNKISYSVTSEMYGMKSVIKYKGKIKGDKIKMTFKRETPDGGGFGGGGRGPRVTNTKSIGGSSMGGMGGMGGGMGMGGPAPSNEFTLERVSNEPVNPVN